MITSKTIIGVTTKFHALKKKHQVHVKGNNACSHNVTYRIISTSLKTHLLMLTGLEPMHVPLGVDGSGDRRLL
jgi:hypothetical protein